MTMNEMVSSSNERSGMREKLMVALGLVLGVASHAAMAQTAPVPADRLCTAGFNPDYGWFDVPSIDRLGVLEFPGQLSQATCVPITPARLAVQIGGTVLPLSGEVVYSNIGSATPTLTTPLLEPALCEDYYVGTGPAVWNLVIKDANDQEMMAPVVGISTLDYNLGSGALMPQRADTATSWLTCYAGLAQNAALGSGVVDENALFTDGLESETNLRVEFLDALGNPLASDVIDQAMTIGANVSVRVRVSNLGTVPAEDVRVREFVPTASTIVGPTVDRVNCIDHGPAGGGSAACSNSGGNGSGIGTNKFAQNIGALLPGAHREFTLTRRSNGTDFSADQSPALIQVAAFSRPDASNEVDRVDNSRSLRIRMVDQIQVSRAVTTNGASGGVGGTISRVSAPAGCSAEAGVVTACPPGATGLVYSAVAANNYTFTGFTGCAGTPAGVSAAGGTYTTTGGTSCSVVANFFAEPTVTATAGANGSISPPSQQLDYGSHAEFTITPAFGHQVVLPISGCGGVEYDAGSSTWTTVNPVTGNCAVAVTFAPKQSTVTATAGPNGAITSQNPIEVTYPIQQAVFTVLADATYEAQVAGTTTCQTINGPFPNPFGPGVMFAADNVLDDCQIDFTFSLITHSVSVSSGMAHGNIVLDAPTVVHGEDAGFTVVPATGYHLDGAVTNSGTVGACGTISLAGNTGTAGPITSAGCELSANFAINQYAVTVSVAAGSESHGTIAAMGVSPGDVVPVVIDPVTHGTSAEFWTFAAPGYYAAVVPQTGCNFIYAGVDALSGAVKFRANAVAATCSMEVQFLQ